MTLIDSFKAARRVSTPLLGITSADPFALVRTLTAALNGQAPVLTRDFVHGLQGKNAAGAEALDALLPPGASPEAMTINPTEALRMAERLPDASCLFFLNAHRFVDNEGVAQALLNLRDAYKSNHRTVILLAPVLPLPIEIQTDVMVFDDPLPDDTALAAIVEDLHVAAKLPAPTP